MGAVWLGLRAELGNRWRAMVGLALLLALGAAVVMATVAGARRTDSAYDRFLVAQHAADVLIPSGGSIFGFADLDPRDVARLPQVEDEARFRYYQLGVPGTPGEGEINAAEGVFFSDRNDRFGTTIDRMRILEGRRPRPDAPFEVAISFLLAEEQGIEVGDTLDLSILRAGTDYQGGESDAVPFEFEVVGIEAAPQEFPPLQDTTVPTLHGSPAFDRRFRGELLGIPGIAVRLENGAADLPAFKAEVERLGGGDPVLLFDQHEHSAGVERSIHVQVQALLLLGGLVAVVVLLVLGQAIVRQVLLESSHLASLRVLGMTRTQLVVAACLRTGVVAGAGALLAVVCAYLLSPLAPAGLAAKAETDPGHAFDVPVMGIGALATVGFAVAAAAATTWWVSRRSPVVRRVERLGRPSRVAGVLARASFPPPTVVGTRMALSAGGGRNALPLRTTLFGTTLAIATGVGAVTFSASLDNLRNDRELYGISWDAEFGGEFAGTLTDEDLDRLRTTPGVAGLAVGTTSEVQLDGEVRVPGLAMDTIERPLEPTVVEGRAPTAPDEILLGSTTIDALDAEVGDRIVVSVGSEDRQMEIVGRGVLPVVGDGGLGRGAFLTFAGLQELTPGADRNIALVRFAPGTDAEALTRALGPTFVGGEAIEDLPLPVDLVNFGRVDSMPSVVAGLMALLAVAALAHALVTAVRRRRVDLAILKTLGFSRGQLRGTVAWQASALTLVAVVVGLPTGVAAGRWAWRIFADDLGIVYQPVVPVLLIALIVPVSLLLANAVAAVPGWLAARTPAATVLREE
jgi:ABC-type lipoprotein release transport system permease subunit